MPNLNQVNLAGFLTRNPEIRYTPKGTAVAACAVAMNRHFKTESGEAREETTFVDFEMFGPTAEAFGKHFTKGQPVFISGRLRLQKWEDKATKTQRQKLIVVVESWQFMSPPKGNSTPESGHATASPQPEDSGPY